MFEAEAGMEECSCPLPEDQGVLSFWTVKGLLSLSSKWAKQVDLGEGMEFWKHVIHSRCYSLACYLGQLTGPG